MKKNTEKELTKIKVILDSLMLSEIKHIIKVKLPEYMEEKDLEDHII